MEALIIQLGGILCGMEALVCIIHDIMTSRLYLCLLVPWEALDPYGCTINAGNPILWYEVLGSLLGVVAILA